MEAIGRLVSGVAHDFNNLLTGVVLCSDLLLAGLEKDPLRRYAQEIRIAAAHGTELIQQLLGVARQDAVATSLLSFNEAIAGLRNLLARLMGEDIELVTHLADDLGMVKMDPAHVQQIILNLLLNARDAMPDGGRITLTTRNCKPAVGDSGLTEPAGRSIEFEVSDTGCGMDAATRARAFQPFFTTKKPGAGSGLGLATVSSIVQQGGGTRSSGERTGARGASGCPSAGAIRTIRSSTERGGRFGPGTAAEPQIQRQGKQV